MVYTPLFLVIWAMVYFFVFTPIKYILVEYIHLNQHGLTQISRFLSFSVLSKLCRVLWVVSARFTESSAAESDSRITAQTARKAATARPRAVKG